MKRLAMLTTKAVILLTAHAILGVALWAHDAAQE